MPSAVLMAGPEGSREEWWGKIDTAELVSTRNRLPVASSTNKARKPGGPSVTVVVTYRRPLSFPPQTELGVGATEGLVSMKKMQAAMVLLSLLAACGCLLARLAKGSAVTCAVCMTAHTRS